jgi:hypothetical protein
MFHFGLLLLFFQVFLVIMIFLKKFKLIFYF